MRSPPFFFAILAEFSPGCNLWRKFSAVWLQPPPYCDKMGLKSSKGNHDYEKIFLFSGK
jgi:hypothetical protein